MHAFVQDKKRGRQTEGQTERDRDRDGDRDRKLTGKTAILQNLLAPQDVKREWQLAELLHLSWNQT
jgi:hypothetical protein